MSLQAFGGMSTEEEWTFQLPYIPELNEYYGQISRLNLDQVRAEAGGIGIVQSIGDVHITLFALPVRDLFTKLFKIYGFAAKPSQAGLIAARLIKQMGDLQKCRVFKIGGVRNLIEAYAPFESFTRSTATQTIGNVDPTNGRPRFTAYEHLHLGPRQSGKLTPNAAFTWLLEHKVFRAGLKLRCPNCDLDFWLPINDLDTEVACEFCGVPFNLTPQLRDRDWAYRRSGLFGRDNHQEGGIPVAITLQQLDTTLRRPFSAHFYTTAQILSKGTTSIEVDFLWLAQNNAGRIQLVIGEWKSNATIPDSELQKDIDNLTTIAQELSRSRVEVYILFSKTSDFTRSEIQLLKTSLRKHAYQLILMSRRELEPYHIYEWTKKAFGKELYVSTLDQLVQATEFIYFNADDRGKVVHTNDE